MLEINESDSLYLFNFFNKDITEQDIVKLTTDQGTIFKYNKENESIEFVSNYDEKDHSFNFIENTQNKDVHTGDIIFINDNLQIKSIHLIVNYTTKEIGIDYKYFEIIINNEKYVIEKDKDDIFRLKDKDKKIIFDETKLNMIKDHIQQNMFNADGTQKNNSTLPIYLTLLNQINSVNMQQNVYYLSLLRPFNYCTKNLEENILNIRRQLIKNTKQIAIGIFAVSIERQKPLINLQCKSNKIEHAFNLIITQQELYLLDSSNASYFYLFNGSKNPILNVKLLNEQQKLTKKPFFGEVESNLLKLATEYNLQGKNQNCIMWSIFLNLEMQKSLRNNQSLIQKQKKTPIEVLNTDFNKIIEESTKQVNQLMELLQLQIVAPIKQLNNKKIEEPLQQNLFHPRKEPLLPRPQDLEYFQQLQNQYLSNKGKRKLNEFIDSTDLNELVQDTQMPILSSLNFNADDDIASIINTVDNNEEYNFIYTVGSNTTSQGTHYIAVKIFKNSDGKLIVLFSDLNNSYKETSEEFINLIQKSFGQETNIKNVSDLSFQQEDSFSCGLFALTALKKDGLLEREKLLMQKNSPINEQEFQQISQSQQPDIFSSQSQIKPEQENQDIKKSEIKEQEQQPQLPSENKSSISEQQAQQEKYQPVIPLSKSESLSCFSESVPTQENDNVNIAVRSRSALTTTKEKQLLQQPQQQWVDIIRSKSVPITKKERQSQQQSQSPSK